MGETNFPHEFTAFEKEIFNDSYTAMWNLQQQTEKIAQNLIFQQTGQSEDVLNLLNDWIRVLQDECKQFKARTDAGYQKMQSFLPMAMKKIASSKT